MGFVAPGGSATGGPDPKDMVPKLREFRRLMEDALKALERGNAAAAAAKLRQAAAINERERTTST